MAITSLIEAPEVEMLKERRKLLAYEHMTVARMQCLFAGPGCYQINFQLHCIVTNKHFIATVALLASWLMNFFLPLGIIHCIRERNF
jgi:hypothetical protein